MQVQLEAPLVFSGREIAEARKRSEPAPQTSAASTLPLSSKPADPRPAEVVLPPAEPKPKSKGFFGSLKGFFSKIF